MAEAKSYEPVGGQDDLIIEAFVRAGEGFSVGGDDNPWPYSTEDTGEQAFLDAHSLVKEQGAEDPSNASVAEQEAAPEAEAEHQPEEASASEAGEQPEEGAEN